MKKFIKVIDTAGSVEELTNSISQFSDLLFPVLGDYEGQHAQTNAENHSNALGLVAEGCEDDSVLPRKGVNARKCKCNNEVETADAAGSRNKPAKRGRNRKEKGIRGSK